MGKVTQKNLNRGILSNVEEEKNRKVYLEGIERREWLEDAIEEYVRENDNKDSVDIVSHFKLRADVIMESLHILIEQKRVKRLTFFNKSVYKIN